MPKAFLSLVTFALLFGTTLCANSTTTESPPYTPPPDREDIGVLCTRNDHYTDPKFTCCASIKYDAPPLYTNPGSSCWSKGGSEDKIIKSAWTVFKCLVDEALGGKPLTFGTLTDIMMGVKFPADVKSGIKAYLKNMSISGYAPYAGIPELKGFETYANAWNAYYLAENWACSDAGYKGRQKLNITEDNGNYGLCYNWVDQGTRRGDCCKRVAIPFQLIPDPIVDRYYALKNWTATHLMTLASKDYNWQNTTIVMYSDNIATCLRTAMFIQQGVTSEAEVKKQMDGYIPPNYGQFADALIPKWMGKGVRDKIKEDVANETAINSDSDIQAFNDTSVSLYQFVYADEWKGGQYSENKTRVLFWTCRAHNLIMRRFKDSPMSEFCV